MNKIITAIITTGILLSVPLVAFGDTPSTTTQLNLPCIQTAVDAREHAIGAAFATFSTAIGSALTTRATALHNAWGITDASARRSARLAAWSAFRTANRAAFATLRAARKSAWSAFTTASKACHTPVVETASSEGTGSLGL